MFLSLQTCVIMADSDYPPLQVPMERRNNRATMATFKMTTGAIACLSHTLLLHGSDFFSAMDITGDGYHIIIHDPYQNPSLQVRRPFTNHYEQASLHLWGHLWNPAHSNCSMFIHTLLSYMKAVWSLMLQNSIFAALAVVTVRQEKHHELHWGSKCVK